MIVDASVIVSILAHENDADLFLRRLDLEERKLISPVSVFEAILGLARIKKLDPAAARELVASFLAVSEIKTVEVTAATAELAVAAHARYGKGCHPASLNLGDCFSYAAAREHGVPLLYKGDDFARTDLG